MTICTQRVNAAVKVRIGMDYAKGETYTRLAKDLSRLFDGMNTWERQEYYRRVK